jgi:hypothetical protein
MNSTELGTKVFLAIATLAQPVIQQVLAASLMLILAT